MSGWPAEHGSAILGEVSVETVLLQAMTARGGPVAEACLRWLVTGELPGLGGVDVVCLPAAGVGN